MKKVPADPLLSLLDSIPKTQAPPRKKRGRRAEINTGVPELDERIRTIQKEEQSASLTSKWLYSDQKLSDLNKDRAEKFLNALEHFSNLASRGYGPGEDLVLAIIREHEKYLTSLHELALANAVKAELRESKSLSNGVDGAFKAVAAKLSKGKSKTSANRVRKNYYKKLSSPE